MGVEAVIATQVIDTTTVGRSLMTAADAASARTALSLGTLATQSGTFSGTSSGTNTGDQDLSGYLTSVAAAAAYQAILVSGTNIKTVNGSTLLGSGDLAISGLSGTGSVDNAVLRADGTGGATLQNSAFVIADNATASPNNTVNHASISATGGTTNVSVSIVPKGTGAFCLQVPDGTSAGGNARGANSVDFQMVRTSAAQVASSDYAFVVGSNNQLSTASYQACVGQSNQLLNGNHQYVFGASNVLTNASFVFVAGTGNTATGSYGLAIGDRNSLTSNYGSVRGYFASSYLSTMRAVAQDGYAVVGDMQLIEVTNKAKTTSAAPVSWSVAIPSGKMWVVTITAGGIKSDGSATAGYIRKVTAKNVGGTVAVVSSTTIGTDNEDNAATDFAVTASGANMLLTVTGIAAETWRWQFAIYGVDIKYGT